MERERERERERGIPNDIMFSSQTSTTLQFVTLMYLHWASLTL